MSRSYEFPTDCKVYIGNLRVGDFLTLKNEIRSAFSQIGPLRDVWVAKNPPGFAIVHFDDPRDARDAVHIMDGRKLCENRIRVEYGRPRQNAIYEHLARRRARNPHEYRFRDPYPTRCFVCSNCEPRMDKRRVRRINHHCLERRRRSTFLERRDFGTTRRNSKQNTNESPVFSPQRISEKLISRSSDEEDSYRTLSSWYEEISPDSSPVRGWRNERSHFK